MVTLSVSVSESSNWSTRQPSELASAGPDFLLLTPGSSGLDIEDEFYEKGKEKKTEMEWNK